MKIIVLLAFVWFAIFSNGQLALSADVLPEFAYREITVNVVRLDGRPLPGASVYGFCPDLNLLSPRQDSEFQGRNDVLWDKSFLGTTGMDGSLKMTVPPGRWGFFAVGLNADESRTLIAAWTDFRERSDGEAINLAPVISKQWTLCSADGAALEVKHEFLKPDGFPIYIPADLETSGSAVQTEISAGDFQMWAAGNATDDHPGFVLSLGNLEDHTPDGKILAQDKPAMIGCKGGQGHASLSWMVTGHFGLEGEVALPADSRVLVTAGDYILSYRRPVGDRLTGRFVGQFYQLPGGSPVNFDFNKPLSAGIAQAVSKPDDQGQTRLDARLYLVDGNGYLLAELLDDSGTPADFDATAILDGERIPAHPVMNKSEAPGQGESGQTMFTATTSAPPTAVGATWEIMAPPEVLEQKTFPPEPAVRVTSGSFKVDVPKVLVPEATNLLKQAEILAKTMEVASGRKRRLAVTNLNIKPGSEGAAAAHNGAEITIGTKLFYSDTPILRHDFVHELGHNFDFTHGGLHETTVEVSRCAGGEQISQQPAKWMFLDRMNGLTREEIGYPKTGLYMYCYAKGGPAFLRFMSTNEYPIIKQLGTEGYTPDEVAAALCGIALKRDMTDICSRYGMTVTPDRVAAATKAASGLCQVPK